MRGTALASCAMPSQHAWWANRLIGVRKPRRRRVAIDMRSQTMMHQETYDPTLDAPQAPPGPPLPDEEYYRQSGAPRRAGRPRGLGVALVLVGIMLLAFQIVGRGLPFGGAVGATTLVDQTLPGDRIELVAA